MATGEDEGRRRPQAGGTGALPGGDDRLDRRPGLRGTAPAAPFSRRRGPLLPGETGEHYARTMAERRAELPDGGAVASKRVGWSR